MSEMRLIDANAADVERICCYYGDNCRIEDVQEWLDDQPTIAVVPPADKNYGSWYVPTGMMPAAHHGRHRCTECGSMALYESPGRECLSSHCPNCGIYMTNGDHHHA